MTKVHCHLCGAALRLPEHYHLVVRPDRGDEIYLCRDEKRCAMRAAFDPPTQRSVDPRTRARR
jgi:hypothetical protein